MAWFVQPGEDQVAHRGTLARGRVVTDCGLSFPAAGAAPANLAAGGDEICRPCAAGQVQRLADTAAGSWMPRRLSRSWARDGLAGLAGPLGWLAGAAVLIVFIYLAWPR